MPKSRSRESCRVPAAREEGPAMKSGAPGPGSPQTHRPAVQSRRCPRWKAETLDEAEFRLTAQIAFDTRTTIAPGRELREPRRRRRAAPPQKCLEGPGPLGRLGLDHLHLALLLQTGIERGHEQLHRLLALRVDQLVANAVFGFGEIAVQRRILDRCYFQHRGFARQTDGRADFPDLQIESHARRAVHRYQGPTRTR